MDTKKIVITGGPGTGKTSVINDLKDTEIFDNEIISKIQSLLIKISIPIWETTQQLSNNSYA